MAETWAAIASSVSQNITRKFFLQVYNNGVDVLRVYRVWVTNTQVSPAVTGVINQFWLFGVTGSATGAGSVGASAVAYDSLYSTGGGLTGVIITSGGATWGGGDPIRGATQGTTGTWLYRRFTYSTDEFATGVFKFDNLLGVPSLSLIWDGGYGATGNVEPIVLRNGQGLVLGSLGVASATGTFDCIMEFTRSQS